MGPGLRQDDTERLARGYHPSPPTRG